MDKSKFIEIITSHILEYLPKEYQDAQIEVIERAKNNDTMLHGLIIHSGEKKDIEAAPIFYLEPYYDAYRFGEKDMEDVMHELARDYLQVIRNQECLKDLVNLPVDGGFSLTVYIDMDTPRKDAMIQITKDMASRMNFDERELIQTAMKNTVQAHPAELVEMKKVMMDISGLRKLEPDDNLLQDHPLPAEDLSMLILSNSDKFFGATALFYPDVQAQVADATGGSYYILPSSVHELIVLPDNGTFEERELARMVQSVNSCEVRPEEQLGNKVLYYNASMDRLMVAVDLDREKERGKER